MAKTILIAYTDRKDFIRRICILAPDTAGMVRLGAKMQNNTQFVEYGKLGEFKADGFSLKDIRLAIGEPVPSPWEKPEVVRAAVETRDFRDCTGLKGEQVRVFKPMNSRPPREADFTGVSEKLQADGKYIRSYAK